MKAETLTLQLVLHGDRRFVVPVYQRPYVWERERQWEPLWDDIEATALRLAEARVDGAAKGLDAAQADKSAAPHFLGAIVIEQSPTVTGDVDTRLVVDGQQRLTTVQLLLRGVLDALDEVKADKPTRAKVRKAILNDEEVVSAVELLKVTPRLAEIEVFGAAMALTAPDPGDSVFAAARAYFEESALAFLRDEDVPADPYAAGDAGTKEAQRGSLLAATVLGLVKLVVIDLEDVDDPQVIFEALNARNTPLSATDLVKNLLFLRAIREHADPEVLYESLWKRFDDDNDWWRKAVGTGHAQRARQDWLLGDWLVAQRSRSINVGRLYGEFRRWLDESGAKAHDALRTLSEYADAYESLTDRRSGSSEVERRAYSRIERLNITVVSPVLLWLTVQPTDVLDPVERERAITAIESYLVRRMAVKDQTRAYGAVFVEVLKAATSGTANPGQAVIEALREAPHGYSWPSADELVAAFVDGRYYGPGGINQDRLRLLLGAVDAHLQGAAHKGEDVVIDYTGLQIEHVIPKAWRKYWPVSIEDPTLRAVAEQERDRHVHRIGNLTLATGSLNNSMSHDPWAAKCPELKKHSKLELNALLVENDSWDERDIVARGEWLALQVDAVWPGPDAKQWSS